MPAPLVPASPLAPQAGAGAFLPMMMFMGRRGRRSNSSPAYDPYQCVATCAAQQGFCPPPSAFLQLLEEGPSFLELAPAPPLTPQAGSSMGFVYPMMMTMANRKRKAGNSLSDNPMLKSCVNSCQAQLGCGALPDGDGGGGVDASAEKGTTT